MLGAPPRASALVPADRGILQQGQHRGAFVEEQADVAVRLRRPGQCPVQFGERLALGARARGGSALAASRSPAGCRRASGRRRRASRSSSSSTSPARRVAARPSTVVTGEPEPHEGEVVVLAQERRGVRGDVTSWSCAHSCGRVEVPGRDVQAGPHRRDGADVGVEAGPVQRLAPGRAAASAVAWSPVAARTCAMATYQRCRFSVIEPRSPSTLAVSRCASRAAQVVELAVQLGEPDVQVGGGPRVGLAVRRSPSPGPARTAGAPGRGGPR